MATRSGGTGKGGGAGAGKDGPGGGKGVGGKGGGGKGGAGTGGGGAGKGPGVAPARGIAARRSTTSATRNRARGGDTPPPAGKSAAKSALQAAAKTAGEVARATAEAARSTIQTIAEAAGGGPARVEAEREGAVAPVAAAIEAKARPGKARGGAKPESGARPAPQETGGRVMALELKRGTLSPEMQAYFAKCEEKLGYVPNVLLAYAHDTVKLEAFAALYNDLMLAPSGLSKLEREMIAVAVSSVNRCYYCLTAHGAAVRQLSGDPVLGEMLVMNYRAADLSVRHRAMLDFAVQLTEQPDSIESEDREILRDAGFSERDVWDIAAVASFFNMSNRMAAAVDMRPNRSYHGDTRVLP